MEWLANEWKRARMLMPATIDTFLIEQARLMWYSGALAHEQVITRLFRENNPAGMLEVSQELAAHREIVARAAKK